MIINIYTTSYANFSVLHNTVYKIYTLILHENDIGEKFRGNFSRITYCAAGAVL